jgi:hypothetical protein
VLRWAAGITGSDIAGAGGAFAFGQPALGCLILAPLLALALIASLIVAIALLGPDNSRSRFERMMALMGMILKRRPADYDFPKADIQAPRQIPGPDQAPDCGRTLTRAPRDGRPAAFAASVRSWRLGTREPVPGVPTRD